jgi:hypothetical protein
VATLCLFALPLGSAAGVVWRLEMLWCVPLGWAAAVKNTVYKK